MLSTAPARPLRTLVGAFLVWKAFLLAVAVGAGAAGPAYDTSSTLLALAPSPGAAATAADSSREALLDLGTRLTRWDAIYFVQAARRGGRYLFEQEWAFGGALPTVISHLARALERLGARPDAGSEALAGIVIAHVSHLLSVLVLHQLGLVVWRAPRLALVAALLHLVSPAGIFLSAPYNESPYALLSFLGYLLFAKGVLGEEGRRSAAAAAAHDASLVAAGLCFGLAVLFRSNGLLNGVLFAGELGREILRSRFSWSSVRRQLVLVVGGSAVAAGFLLPQVVAYRTFCLGTSSDETRSWCTRRLPSIYSFVQEHYWNVGFLRYWTPGNIPLFALAAPMLYLLAKSGVELFSRPSVLAERSGGSRLSASNETMVRSMAASQIILTVLAITTYHIQIITRISSGYPLWYWWLAGVLADQKQSRFGGAVVVYMVMYAGIQASLFASFLPPA
ncbi:glycosyltransferase family 76 protein [Xylariaceae sp. FL0804]|nr:glycosyltransferase family 76 protein [Xylariaceae sp. FL0804]